MDFFLQATFHFLCAGLYFIQPVDLSASINANIKNSNNFYFPLPDATRTNQNQFVLKLPHPDLTSIFTSWHKTTDMSSDLCCDKTNYRV